MELQQNKWKHVHEKQKGEKLPWYAMNRDTITIQDLEFFEKPKEEQPFSESISSAFKEFASTLHQCYKISCVMDSDSYVLKNIKKKDIMELDHQSSDSEEENEDDESNAKFHKRLAEDKRQHKQYLRKIGAPLPESVTSTKKKKGAEEDDSEDESEEEEEEEEEDMSDDEPSSSKNQKNSEEEDDFAFSKFSKEQKLKLGKQPKVSKKKLLTQFEKEKQDLEHLPLDQKASKVSDKKLQSSLLKLEGKREVNEKTLKHKLKIQKQKKNKSKKEWSSKIEKEGEDIKRRKEKRDENRKNKKNRGKKEFLQQKKDKAGGIKKQKKMRPGFEGKKDKTLN